VEKDTKSREPESAGRSPLRPETKAKAQCLRELQRWDQRDFWEVRPQQHPRALAQESWQVANGNTLLKTLGQLFSRTDTVVQFLWQDDRIHVAWFIADCFDHFQTGGDTSALGGENKFLSLLSRA
jgi:hypothetical protein